MTSIPPVSTTAIPPPNADAPKNTSGETEPSAMAPHALTGWKKHGRLLVVGAGAALACVAVFVVVMASSSQAQDGVASGPSPASTAPALPAGRVVVALTSEPNDATVSWNGHPVGRTPLRIALPAGTQTLTVSKEGRVSEAVVVELSANAGETTSHVVLPPRAWTSPVAEPVTSPPDVSGDARPGDGRANGHARLSNPRFAPKASPPPSTIGLQPVAAAPPATAPAPAPISGSVPSVLATSKVRVLDDEAIKAKVLE